MRTSLFAATAALALLAAPVMAQTTGGSPRPSGGASGQTAAPRAPMPNPMTQEDVSKIKGADVYGTDDKKIGTVDTVLMNPQSKSIDRLVVKAGGVLGVGGHDVAIPVDQFNWDSGKEGFRLSKTADDLKNMPEWKAASSGGSTSSGSSGASRTTGMGTSGGPSGSPTK
jgi:sporulation protein YlmC with PRC-barrel domain